MRFIPRFSITNAIAAALTVLATSESGTLS